MNFADLARPSSVGVDEMKGQVFGRQRPVLIFSAFNKKESSDWDSKLASDQIQPLHKLSAESSAKTYNRLRL